MAVDDSVESVTLTAQWKRDWTAIEVEPYEDVYDGQKHGVTVNGVVEGDKVQYSVDGKNFSDTVPEYADVTKENDGRYPVYVKVTNGTESIDKESYVKINPKPLTRYPQMIQKFTMAHHLLIMATLIQKMYWWKAQS